MVSSSRRTCCGFNVAQNCVGGPALLIGIPLMVMVHMRMIVLTPLFTQSCSDTQLLLEVLLEFLWCLLAELCLFLLLVTDPGFTQETTELSCRCASCRMEVEDFDHHCGVLGACIGCGNMCYFILFLFFASLLCLTGGAMNAVYAASVMETFTSGQEKGAWRSYKAVASAARTFLGSLPNLCLLLLSSAAMCGGGVCLFLCLRYTYLAYHGRSSVRRRRRETLRGSLSVVFANVFRPKFAHNYRPTTLYASEEMSPEFD